MFWDTVNPLNCKLSRPNFGWEPKKYKETLMTLKECYKNHCIFKLFSFPVLIYLEYKLSTEKIVIYFI